MKLNRNRPNAQRRLKNEPAKNRPLGLNQSRREEFSSRQFGGFGVLGAEWPDRAAEKENALLQALNFSIHSERFR